MKRRTRVFLQLASSCLTLCLALSASSFAASNNNAYLYIVHGIPGRDVADNLNPGLPIDVLIDGKCPVHGLTFGSTSGPLTIAAGTYDVQISTANTLAPCTNPELIKAYYYLMQIAHMILQIFEAGSLLQRLAAECGRTPWQLFGGLANLARRLLESFRYRHLSEDAFASRPNERMQYRFNSS